MILSHYFAVNSCHFTVFMIITGMFIGAFCDLASFFINLIWQRRKEFSY